MMSRDVIYGVMWAALVNMITGTLCLLMGSGWAEMLGNVLLLTSALYMVIAIGTIAGICLQWALQEEPGGKYDQRGD